MVSLYSTVQHYLTKHWWSPRGEGISWTGHSTSWKKAYIEVKCYMWASNQKLVLQALHSLKRLSCHLNPRYTFVIKISKLAIYTVVWLTQNRYTCLVCRCAFCLSADTSVGDLLGHCRLQAVAWQCHATHGPPSGNQLKSRWVWCGKGVAHTHKNIHGA